MYTEGWCSWCRVYASRCELSIKAMSLPAASHIGVIGEYTYSNSRCSGWTGHFLWVKENEVDWSSGLISRMWSREQCLGEREAYEECYRFGSRVQGLCPITRQHEGVGLSSKGKSSKLRRKKWEGTTETCQQICNETDQETVSGGFCYFPLESLTALFRLILVLNQA